MNAGVEPIFWMGNRYATNLQLVTHDPREITADGFWAVSISFEGHWTCAKFSNVKQSDFKSDGSELVTNKFTSSMSQDDYISYVTSIQEDISNGEVYQANACRILSTTVSPDFSLAPLFSAILENNPAPYASFLRLPGLEIASASPELFLKRSGAKVTSSPIKGTRPSGGSDFGSKDQAENIMIVDLIRNDLGQICKDGSIDVPRLLAIEEHPGLDHLVSDVTGELKDDLDWYQVISPLLPPGSVSGAPKSSAVRIIAEHEINRGPYCGAIGWIQGDSCELAVAIRTFWKDGQSLQFGTGAGITWASDPQAEWEETELKAQRLIKIASGEIS
ncbi:MAG: chorismate-binding protein [Candidatus Planktophila sp.]|jgi:para-aminobenzoate synthetase component 1|nr:chorismate-binding protein [Candidatus Planktophila sp.]